MPRLATGWPASLYIYHPPSQALLSLAAKGLRILKPPALPPPHASPAPCPGKLGGGERAAGEARGGAKLLLPAK